MGKLDGKTAIVTGRATGIGRHYTEALAREGATVASPGDGDFSRSRPSAALPTTMSALGSGSEVTASPCHVCFAQDADVSPKAGQGRHFRAGRHRSHYRGWSSPGAIKTAERECADARAATPTA